MPADRVGSSEPPQSGGASRCAVAEVLVAAFWIAPLPRLVLKLVVGALPVDEVAAMRSAFLDPDAMSAFPDAMLVGLARELDRRRSIAR
jgi:hypothetical protein